jgi:hypothetical protein
LPGKIASPRFLSTTHDFTSEIAMTPSHSAAPTRRLAHTRQIVCTGYIRCDGLFDIEGRMVDTKADHVDLLFKSAPERAEPRRHACALWGWGFDGARYNVPIIGSLSGARRHQGSSRAKRSTGLCRNVHPRLKTASRHETQPNPAFPHG